MENINLKNKVIIISGGSDGLGKAIASHLKSTNKVIIISPSKTKLESVALELGVDFQVCDVSKYEDCKLVLENILTKYGSIDVLVNNAGLWIQGELDENTPENIKMVIEVNTLGVAYLSKAAVSFMKKQKSGTIININSQGGFYAKEERSIYTLTKWGITGFSKSLQPELAKYGIRVTDIHPGKMHTQMFEKMGINKDMKDALNPKYVAQIIETIINLPDEVVIPEVGIKHLTN